VEEIEPAAPPPAAEPEPPPRIEVERLEEAPSRRPRGRRRGLGGGGGGFGRARAAISACGRQHGAIEGTSLRVSYDVIGGRATSVSVQRPYSVTPLGRCVANAVSDHARFSGADAPGQSRKIDF
jgi:hypothetical protein